MTTTINADTVTGGAIVTGDASGQLGLQAAGVTKLTVSSAGVTLATPLAVASGGTGGSATATAGGIAYGTGTVQAFTAAGTSGQVLVSNGSSAPTWGATTPNLNVDGATIYVLGSQGLYTYRSTSGWQWGSTNIVTTAPVLAGQALELRANLDFSPSSASSIASSYLCWNGSSVVIGNGQTRILYDYYTSRFVQTLTLAGGGTATINVYSTDGVNWIPFTNAYVAYTSTNTVRLPAFNKYTGIKVTSNVKANGTQDTSGILNTYSAANAYNETATATSSFDAAGTFANNVQMGMPTFVDTGTQATSMFMVAGVSSTASTAGVFSSVDGTTWSSYSIGNKQAPSRIIGTSTELMFYCSNGGAFRSTNMGTSWTNFNFGSNTGGTAAGSYWGYMAWNGSYWLGTFYNDTNTLVSRAMGTGTTFTTLTNLTTPGVTNWKGVAWNPTLAVWIIIKNNGDMYTNSSSDPNAGTWTFVRALTGASGNTSSGYDWPLYVKAASTFNY
jgi:hypothetical protein